jgi:hypothetical protein
MIKRLIGKLKTLRLYFVIYSIFKRNNSDFYKNLMRDWGKDDVYGPWTKYKKDDGKLRFYKSYYMITDDKPTTIDLIGIDNIV